VLSLVARIDELSEQNKKLLEQISTLLAQNSMLLARIAELEARGGKPPKTRRTRRFRLRVARRATLGTRRARRRVAKGAPAWRASSARTPM
jgi:hypothetical protein